MNCLEVYNISQVIFMLTKDTALLKPVQKSPQPLLSILLKCGFQAKRFIFPQSLSHFVLRKTKQPYMYR